MKKKCIDILLIQPPVSKRINQEEEIIQSYFSVVNSVASYLGDSPIEPNLGLLNIAANIRTNTLKEVVVLDLNLVEYKIRKEYNRQISIEEIRYELNKYDAQIIGLSFMTVTYGIWGKELTKLCSEIFSGANIFLGGIHPTVKYKEVWEQCKDWIDGVIVGEGEITFCNLINPIFHGDHALISENPNLYQGDDSKQIVRAKLNSHELYNLPLPAYDLMEPKGEPIVVRIYTTRGCLRQCSFCSVSEFYSKSIPVPISNDITKILDQFNKILHNLDVSHLVIGDLSFLNDRMSSKELLTNLSKLKKNRDFNMDWWCQSRADLINPESVSLLKNAGCKQIAIGCEAGTDQQLNIVRKGESCREIESSLKLIKRNKIEVQGYWVIGLPGDNFESIKATQKKIIEYIQKGLVKIPHVSILVPYPNTPVALKPHEYGIRILHEDWDKYWMNCDLFGCGEPVYETIDKRKTLLTSSQIYDTWLETLQLITNELK